MQHSVDYIRCPVTGQELTLEADGWLVSSDGRYRYPIEDGIPILIAGDSHLFESARASFGGGGSSDSRSLKGAIKRLIPSKTLAVGQPERFVDFTRLVTRASLEGKPRVLIVGGGIAGGGTKPLLEHPGLELVETDVYRGPRVDLICDGNHLPFADGSFDGVVVQAVLQHVQRPWEVVAEIHRVLKPNGIVYAESAFMQQVCAGAFDYMRFSDLGHRALFRDFDEIGRGVVCGPGTALAWAIAYFARSLPRRSLAAAQALGAAATILFSWVRYADRMLIDHPGSLDAASGFWFMGSRSDTGLSDSEVLEAYEGAHRRIPRTLES